MKIKWTGLQMEIPKIGILTEDDIKDVPDEIAGAMIKQGYAVLVKEAPASKKIKDEEE